MEDIPFRLHKLIKGCIRSNGSRFGMQLNNSTCKSTAQVWAYPPGIIALHHKDPKALPDKQAQVKELPSKCLKNSSFGRQFCPLLTIYESLTWNWRHLIWCSQKFDNASHFYIAVFGQSQMSTLRFAIIRWFSTTSTVLHHKNCQKRAATPYQNRNFGEL